MPVNIADTEGNRYTYSVGSMNGKCYIYNSSVKHVASRINTLYDVSTGNPIRHEYGVLGLQITFDDVIALLNAAIRDIDATSSNLPFIYETIDQCLQNISEEQPVKMIHFRKVVL